MQTESKEAESGKPQQGQAPHSCVFLQRPFADCYCMNMTSSNIRKMLAFCIGDFRSCGVYRRESEPERSPER